MAKPKIAVLPAPETAVAAEETPQHAGPWHVILHNDDDHSYEYVIVMLMALFGHTMEKAYQCAKEVDTTGRVIVDTTSQERAELKRDQIHAYGPDHRIPRCAGSMSASVEPA